MKYLTLLCCVIGAITIGTIGALTYLNLADNNSNNVDACANNLDELSDASLNYVSLTQETSTDSNIESQSSTLQILEIRTKEDIYHKVLNSVDYYNIASGKIETNFLNGEDALIEYNVNMEDTQAYQHVTSYNFDEETFVNDGLVYTVNNELKDVSSKNDLEGVPDYVSCVQAISKSEDIVAYSDDSVRITTEDGVPNYYYRLNPTNVHYASTVSIFPQEMAFGFLSNLKLWEIVRQSQYLNRECTIIAGKTEKDYGAKLNINSFIMTIDNQSGIILCFEGYDTNGNVVSYIKTTEFTDNETFIPTINDEIKEAVYNRMKID